MTTSRYSCDDDLQGAHVLSNRSMPQCMVIPELAYPDVGQAVDWLCETFGFSLRVRIANHRAQLNVGDGAIVVTEQRIGDSGASSSSTESSSAHPTSHRSAVTVRVDNVDRHHELAKQRGARVLRPLRDYPYGERQCTVVDFAGHCWTFSQSIADVAPEEWDGTSAQLG